MGRRPRYEKDINISVYPDAVQPFHPGEYFVPPCEKPEPVSLWETCQAALDKFRKDIGEN